MVSAMRFCGLVAVLLPVSVALVPVSVKDVANGIRDGLQKGLGGRLSRLSVELPPGAPLALAGDDDFSWFKKPETETAKVVVAFVGTRRAPRRTARAARRRVGRNYEDTEAESREREGDAARDHGARRAVASARSRADDRAAEV